MLITGRRIRSLERHFQCAVDRGNSVVVGLTELDRFTDLLSRIGFSGNPNDGETILPPASLGPISHYNAEGRYDIHRDQPMETAYRTAEWHWTEWHGDDTVERSRLVDVPYRRFPRTFVPPPSIEFTATTAADGSRILSTPVVEYTAENETRICHIVNLFLEAFGECTVFTDDLEAVIPARIVRVNWEILPPGRRPWAQLRREVETVVHEVPGGSQPAIWNRLESVAAHGPEFVAVGRGGFRGYLIFGFPGRTRCVLECTRHGNATYVFDERWEALSQLTKAEILTGNLQTARLIHRQNWHEQLNNSLA